MARVHHGVRRSFLGFLRANQYDGYGDTAFVLFEAEIKRRGYWCSKYEMEAFGDVGQEQCDASRGGGR